jgi:hypothetical protein
MKPKRKVYRYKRTAKKNRKSGETTRKYMWGWANIKT